IFLRSIGFWTSVMKAPKSFLSSPFPGFVNRWYTLTNIRMRMIQRSTVLWDCRKWASFQCEKMLTRGNACTGEPSSSDNRPISSRQGDSQSSAGRGPDVLGPHDLVVARAHDDDGRPSPRGRHLAVGEEVLELARAAAQRGGTHPIAGPPAPDEV